MNFDNQHFGGGTDNEEAAGPMHKDLPQLGGYVMSCSNSVSDSLPPSSASRSLANLDPNYRLAQRRL